MQVKVNSISAQGRHIVIKPQTVDSPLNIREIMGVISKCPDGAVRIGPTQIKLDARLLGGRWKAVLEEILRSDGACPDLKADSCDDP
jgi:hypothetical protein